MATTIKLKNSVTTTAAPSSLVQGEVATNVTDKKIWVGNAASSPVQLLGAGASATLTSLTTSSDSSISGLTVGRGYGSTISNSAFGISVLGSSSLSGGGNTGIGYSALTVNTTGTQNTAIGNSALVVNSTGSENSALGAAALYSNTTGSYNIAVGRSSLFSNTTASNNTAVGYQAGYSNTTGNFNTFVGSRGAGYSNTTGYQNTFVGDYAGRENTTGFANTLIGQGAGRFITTGTKNTVLGIYDGNQGGLDIRTASNYIVLSDGDGNPRAYYDSANSGWNFKFGANITWLSTNINGQADFGGSYVGTGGYDLLRFFNANGQVGAIRLSGSSTTYSTSSDYRLKNNIAPMVGALDKVVQLKPVTYKWNVDGSVGQGFIAHELAEVCPDAVAGEKDAVDAEGKPVYQGIDTSFLVATLTAAIQELNAKVEAQALEIATLKGN